MVAASLARPAAADPLEFSLDLRDDFSPVVKDLRASEFALRQTLKRSNADCGYRSEDFI